MGKYPGVPVTICDDNRFLSTPQEFTDWANGKKQLRMEFFYREMRRATNTDGRQELLHRGKGIMTRKSAIYA